MNVMLPEAEVAAVCRKAGARISVMEALPSGGTHLVCITIEDADAMRKKLKAHLIEGRVKRFPFYNAGRDF